MLMLEIIINHLFELHCLGLCLDDDEDGTPYKFRVNGVTITYMNLQKEYIKAHKKIPKKKSAENQSKASWMRVKDGNVRILIEAHNLEGALIAKVVVQRERAAFAEVNTCYIQKQTL